MNSIRITNEVTTYTVEIDPIALSSEYHYADESRNYVSEKWEVTGAQVFTGPKGPTITELFGWKLTQSGKRGKKGPERVPVQTIVRRMDDAKPEFDQSAYDTVVKDIEEFVAFQWMRLTERAIDGATNAGRIRAKAVAEYEVAEGRNPKERLFEEMASLAKDDGWSGRNNDARRAFRDGFINEATSARWRR